MNILNSIRRERKKFAVDCTSMYMRDNETKKCNNSHDPKNLFKWNLNFNIKSTKLSFELSNTEGSE